MMQESVYKKPVFLNAVAHKSVKVEPLKDFDFVKNLNSVVIVGQEFLESAKHYPVIFTRSKDKKIIPAALLGLRKGENLFVEKNGKWKKGAYIPAFFRRYPYILANNAGQDGSFAVCIDTEYKGFDKPEGMSLFDSKGETTKEFKKIIEFLKNYQKQYESTEDLVRILEAHKLFKDISANITMPKGDRLGIARLLMVDEMALLNQDDKVVLELFRKGYLAWIYAHLYSLSNFRPLIELASENKNDKKKR